VTGAAGIARAGPSRNGNYVRSGSNSDGTVATGNELGSRTPIQGEWNSVPLQLNFTVDNPSDSYSLYAISNEIAGALPAVPEIDARGSWRYIDGSPCETLAPVGNRSMIQ
jgi:hypothetical protein